MPQDELPNPAPESAGKKPPPYVLSLIVCDDVILDQLSKKRTLIGVFSDIFASRFPAIHPKLSLYFELTNGHGTTDISIRLAYASTDEEVFAINGQIEFTDPRMVVHAVFSLNNILFPKPGEYRFQLYGDGELLLERRVILKQVEPQDTPNASN